MPDQRRSVWVNRFQTKLLYRMGIYWLVYTLSLFNLLLAWRLLWEGPGHPWHQLTATVSENVPLFVALLIAVPWILWHAVRFTNRLVGPLTRFQNTISDMTADRPVRPIRLRRGDFLDEMQDDFNALLFVLEQRGAVTLRPASDVARSAE